MSGGALQAHLESGVTTVARCWEVRRKDGTRLGFTDHDLDLAFDGLVFRADTGMSAAALQQGTGLAVDNSEAVGALSDGSVTEADIAAGRFDGAEVTTWLVNWADVAARKVLFRGTLGEITRAGGAFQAELRGLTEWLNRPVGRVYQAPCSAVLGDAACGVDLSDPAFRAEAVVAEVLEVGMVLSVPGAFDPGWFQRGRLNVLDGAAQGLWGSVKRDVAGEGGARRVELWEPLRATLAAGDRVALIAGCDKRFATCREKFGNVLNFQGFPDIPQEEWVMIHPSMARRRDGGSLR
ncbi:DUF2163 domain-containing protein [Marivita sp. GX14005]|uniref:DUF2163 domain-containing protein n=1 Tax=Marivita sp. GX14005 TaxID=2942276 RepID=UPI002018F52E|nr:DUF2163 domain-containing protein [Marivita sp. GX14005]MCL3883718.1 DUF2163 domain-containing protein [Marivita sp. GX14005]